ncbi:MAG TPA: L-threonylcarbamoyladenylate synthase [Luteitalea sp.]|nr:L-threonylcarbamoyladenylate synthase [Luteitalea sp.]
MVPERDIARAVAALQAGDVIGLPTETVYGLAGDASNPAAIARIFAVKGRPASHPVIVHVPGAEHMARWARDIPPAATQLAARFWPGPLTLVLPRQPAVLDAVTGGQDTVALRVPSHPVALAVLRAFDGGLAAPSANRYGHVSPTTADHVRDDLGGEVALVLDGGPSHVGLESTIVACLDGTVRVLRPGRVTRTDIQAVVGPLHDATTAVPRVPGSVASHYAPRTPVELVDAAQLPATLATHAAAGRRVALLTPGDGQSGEAREDSGVRARVDVHAHLTAADTPDGYGRELYAHLRRLDRAGADTIVVVRPPDGDLWLAIHDRLRRAATPRA